MTFPRFKHPSGTEFAVNPAFVIRVINDDDLADGDARPITCRILVAHSDVLEDATGRVAVGVAPEWIVVYGSFEQVIGKLGHAQRIETEVLQ